MKRIFDPELADDDAQVSQVSSTRTMDNLYLACMHDRTRLMPCQHEAGEPAKRRRTIPKKSTNSEDPFGCKPPNCVHPPGFYSDNKTVPLTSQYSSRKSILRPERSSHINTPTGSSSEAALADPAICKNQPYAYPSSISTGHVSDDEENDVMDVVNRSFDQIELTVLSLRKRGDEYKQNCIANKKQISDLRLEKAEGARELADVRTMIVEQVKNNERLEAEKDKVLRDLHESTASTPISKDEKTMDGLTKAKEKAETRWKGYKGQLKEAVRTISDLRNQVAYLETMLEFEEKSGYSSAMSARQLE